jgi:hypothetical protein
MTEKQLWMKIRAAWPGHSMRIEASEGGVDPGTPDAHVSIGGRGMFIELKIWPEELRPLQLPWHIDAIQRGAGAEVWAQVPDGTIWAGTAEDYQCLLDNRAAVGLGWPTGRILAVQLARIRKILLSKSSMV